MSTAGSRVRNVQDAEQINPLFNIVKTELYQATFNTILKRIKIA